MTRSLSSILSVLVMVGCAAGAMPGAVSADGKPEPVETVELDAQTLSFTGRVEKVDLEGGFFGIITDDGRKLDPGGLPASVQRHGQRVQGKARVLTDVMTIRMWGTAVEILEISPAP